MVDCNRMKFNVLYKKQENNLKNCYAMPVISYPSFDFQQSHKSALSNPFNFLPLHFENSVSNL
jgi:hypothetical protein